MLALTTETDFISYAGHLGGEKNRQALFCFRDMSGIKVDGADCTPSLASYAHEITRSVRHLLHFSLLSDAF